MDSTKRAELIERVKILGLPSSDGRLPLVTLDEFFFGNDDFGSIGCNLSPMLGPQFFYEKLKSIRSQPNVQDVLVEVTEIEEEDPATWPFSDRVYVFTNATREDVVHWAAALQPDAVEQGLPKGRPDSALELKAGYQCYGLWWD
jgi:hypothetical protein